MKQSLITIESLNRLNERLDPPSKVKEFALTALSGNIEELDKISPISTWVFNHSEYAFILFSIINFSLNQTKHPQSLAESNYKEQKYLDDNFLRLLKNPEEFLMMEDTMVKEQVIHSNLNYYKNKRLENLKCLEGVFLILEGHGHFRKTDYQKSTGHRNVTHRQALSAFNNRYHINRMRHLSEEQKRDCIRIALLRLPILEKFYPQKTIYFN